MKWAIEDVGWPLFKSFEMDRFHCSSSKVHNYDFKVTKGNISMAKSEIKMSELLLEVVCGNNYLRTCFVYSTTYTNCSSKNQSHTPFSLVGYPVVDIVSFC